MNSVCSECARGTGETGRRKGSGCKGSAGAPAQLKAPHAWNLAKENNYTNNHWFPCVHIQGRWELLIQQDSNVFSVSFQDQV